jgi:hypothetical protein
MKLVRISKMMPDPSAVHVLGSGRVARKLKKRRYKKDVFKR